MNEAAQALGSSQDMCLDAGISYRIIPIYVFVQGGSYCIHWRHTIKQNSLRTILVLSSILIEEHHIMHQAIRACFAWMW